MTATPFFSVPGSLILFPAWAQFYEVMRRLITGVVSCCGQVSSVEQEVCCSTGNLVGHYEAVRDLVNSPHITDDDRCEVKQPDNAKHDQTA